MAQINLKFLFIGFLFSCITIALKAQNPTPPVPLPPQEEEIFRVVEEMPRFPGCEHLNTSSKSKENCAKEAMLEYIYETLEYPNKAKANFVEGMAVVQFTVWKDSTIRDIKVVRDPGEGTGEAAAKVVASMDKLRPRWRPGHNRGNPVCVRYVLPVKFKLDDSEKPGNKSGYSHNDIIPLNRVHENPKFPECENIKDPDCTRESLRAFILENQLYPEEALANKTEGTVMVSFIIERDGTLSNIRARNKLSDGLSKDAVEIIQWMNSEEMYWTPGQMNYEAVRTQYEVEIVYDIEKWNSRK